MTFAIKELRVSIYELFFTTCMTTWYKCKVKLMLVWRRGSVKFE